MHDDIILTYYESWETLVYRKKGEDLCFHFGNNQNVFENCHHLGETLPDIKRAALRFVGPSI